MTQDFALEGVEERKLSINPTGVRVHAEKALLDCGDRRGDFGAVNWADLQVTEVAKVISEDESVRILVLIEEASEGCGLSAPVCRALREIWPDVEFEVRCEW